MRILFTETLRKLRTDKGLSQRELAERMYVTRSTVARWKSGSRLPDAMMILRLSQCLDTDVNKLLSAAESDDAPNVIMVADRKIFLSGALPIPDRNDEKIFLTKLCTVTKARIINTNRRRRQFPQT